MTVAALVLSIAALLVALLGFMLVVNTRHVAEQHRFYHLSAVDPRLPPPQYTTPVHPVALRPRKEN